MSGNFRRDPPPVAEAERSTVGIGEISAIIAATVTTAVNDALHEHASSRAWQALIAHWPALIMAALVLASALVLQDTTSKLSRATAQLSEEREARAKAP